MGMPCGVKHHKAYPRKQGSTKTPQGIPMKAREYENTTRHTHESKGVENTTRHTHESKGVRKHHKAYP
jgi:hypothetical protein